jgi:outer membrane protein TolC
MAAAAVDRVGGSERALRLQVAGLVRESAWRLIADEGERDQIAAQALVLRNLYDDVEKRVRAGDLAPADALLAQAEWLAALAQLREAEQRVDESRIRWRDLTGLSAEPDRRSLVEVEASGVPGDHPEMEAALRATEYARRRLDTVRLSTRAPPELRLGIRESTSGGPDGTQHSLAVGVRLPLATRDRNRPLEVAAVGELDVALAFEQRVRERLDADAATARAALASAERQLAVEQERSKLLRTRTDLIDRSFRAGQTSLPELLRAMGSAAQAHTAAARQDAYLGRARARLHQALGIEP